jgi:hypothetical protein
MQEGGERFFGFRPPNGEITNEKNQGPKTIWIYQTCLRNLWGLNDQ